METFDQRYVCICEPCSEIINYLQGKLYTFNPDDDIIYNALRHNKKQIRDDLFSEDNWKRRNAEGMWYEALIYEYFKSLSQDNDLIKGIVRKGDDIIGRPPRPEFRQNGLYYDNNGQIVIRGNGQDLAEIDLIILDNRDKIIFVEIITSNQNLKHFDKEIIHKRTLFNALTGQVNTQFLLISSVDVTKFKSIKKILSESNIFFALARNYELIKSRLNKSHVINYRSNQNKYPKLIDLSKIKIDITFNYKHIHDRIVNQLLTAAKKGVPFENIKISEKERHLVTKVFIGGLYPQTIKYICDNYIFKIRDKQLSYNNIRELFSKVILAISLPDFRPTLYFEIEREYIDIRKMGNFIKFGPKTIGSFDFERNIPRFVGFTLWLEEIEPCIEKERAEELLHYFLRNEIIGSHKKREKANIKSEYLKLLNP